MPRKQNREGKMPYALRQVEAGATVAKVARKMGVSTATYYAWKKRYGGFGVGNQRKLRQIQEEVCRLEQLVAALSQDKQMLQEAVSKKWTARQKARAGGQDASFFRCQRATYLRSIAFGSQYAALQAAVPGLHTRPRNNAATFWLLAGAARRSTEPS